MAVIIKKFGGGGKGSKAGIAVIAVVVVGFLLSIPLLKQPSPNAPARYKSNTVNFDAPAESAGVAPGNALTGALINNPATDGGFVGGALYKSADGASASADVQGRTAGASSQSGTQSAAGGGNAPAQAAAGSRMATAIPRMSAGSSGGSSSPSGSTSASPRSAQTETSSPSSFYGVGTKPDLGGRTSAMANALRRVESMSAAGASAKPASSARGLASSAFDNSRVNANLATDAEKTYANGGVALKDNTKGIVDSLKTAQSSAPAPNDIKMTLPEQEKDKENFWSKLAQSALQNLVGSVVGALGNSLANSILGDKEKK